MGKVMVEMSKEQAKWLEHYVDYLIDEPSLATDKGNARDIIAALRNAKPAGDEFEVDWVSVPEWANYVAPTLFSGGGNAEFVWRAYENEPEFSNFTWHWVSGKWGHVPAKEPVPLTDIIDFRATLRRRPEGA